MADDWIKRFQNFSMAIDYVDEDIFESLKDLLESVFRDLGVRYFRVLLSGYSIQTSAGETPALSTIWSNQDSKKGDLQIFAEDGNCANQTSYAYHNRKRLWVTARDEGLLARTSQSSDLDDRWSGSTDLPPYVDYRGGDTRTSVILPLEYGGRVFGVLNLEFSEARQLTGRVKSAVESFVGALARVIWLRETNRTQLDDTRDALRDLQAGQDSAVAAFKPRSIFLASSFRADGSVMQELESVLKEEEFSNNFEIEFWKEETTSGSISEQVRANIAAAEFGICYTSEPTTGEESPTRYADNPNVLFEAGMFQMLHELRDDPRDVDAARWIPVRESMELTTPLPFDFAGDRVLIVPRDSDSGEVDKARLKDGLRTAIRSLVVALGLG